MSVFQQVHHLKEQPQGAGSNRSNSDELPAPLSNNYSMSSDLSLSDLQKPSRATLAAAPSRKALGKKKDAKSKTHLGSQTSLKQIQRAATLQTKQSLVTQSIYQQMGNNSGILDLGTEKWAEIGVQTQEDADHLLKVKNLQNLLAGNDSFTAQISDLAADLDAITTQIAECQTEIGAITSKTEELDQQYKIQMQTFATNSEIAAVKQQIEELSAHTIRTFKDSGQYEFEIWRLEDKISRQQVRKFELMNELRALKLYDNLCVPDNTERYSAQIRQLEGLYGPLQ